MQLLGEGIVAKVYLSLGTNLGDRLKNLQGAVVSLGKLGKIEKLSSIYKTKPWDVPEEQPYYLNQNCQLDTEISSLELLEKIFNIEKKLGRKNKGDMNPRVIDIDLLLYENTVQRLENLIIPHPEMTKRAFVMIPLAEIAPDLIINGFNETIQEIANDLDFSGVELFKK